MTSGTAGTIRAREHLGPATWFKAPWIASPRSSRWLAVVVVALCGLSAASAVHGLDGRARLLVPAALWSCAIGAWCALVAGNALFVARDATALRLPGLRGAANGSVLANGLLMVLLPALAFGALLGHLSLWMLGFALVASGCLLFLLLPSGLAILLCIGFGPLARYLHPQRPSLALLQWELLALVVVLGLLAAWQWLRLLDREAPTAYGYGVPLIWSLRLQSMYGFGMRSGNPDVAAARGSRQWLRPTPDLHGLGPRRPARSIRVALGRVVMPQTAASLLRRAGFSMLIVVCVGALPTIAQLGQHDFNELLKVFYREGQGGLGVAVMIAAGLPLLAAFTLPLPVRSRWAPPAPELALLALLPGLGDAAAARGHVRHAALLQAARVGVCECVALCAIAAWMHAPALVFPLAALVATSTVALAAAVILGTLAGRPLPRVLLAAMVGLLAALAGSAIGLGFGATAVMPPLWPGLFAALSALLVILAMLCVRYWRGMALRPHPFLAGIS